MSELKAVHAFDVYEAYTKTGDDDAAQVYLKSEADKVIAELERRLNEAHTELELWRDGSIISEEHQKELDGKRHADYKRCLAMAMWCDEAYHRECGLNPEEMTDKEFYKQQIEFWPRWSSRWLAIAEKLKPNSTAQ